MIRKAKLEDLEDILNIYHYAREYMKKNGNSTQWGNIHPAQSLIEEDIKKGIQEFKLTKNRMDILEKNHKTVIDGTYNASVDSMKSSIDVLANYKKRKVAILADMLELGDYSQQLHEEVGSYVASKGIDILVCVGKEAKYIYQKARESMKDVYYFESNQEVIARLDELLKEDDVILVKGSHSMNLKEVVEKI